MMNRLTVNSCRRDLSRLAAVVALAVSAGRSTPALAQHSDVLLANVGGHVAVGAASDIGGMGESFDLDTRVFEGLLLGAGILPPGLAKDFEGNEPGFFALDGTANAGELSTLGAAALPGNADVSVSLTTFSLGGAPGEVLYWSGGGAVAFEPVPAGVTFNFAPAGAFATTGPTGALDGHPIYQLDNGGAGQPADGVYVIAPSVTVAGLAPSNPVYLVLLADELVASEADAEDLEVALEQLEEGTTTEAIFAGKDFAFYEEAVEFVDATFAVPEPSAVGLVVAALGAAIVRRRVRNWQRLRATAL